MKNNGAPESHTNNSLKTNMAFPNFLAQMLVFMMSEKSVSNISQSLDKLYPDTANSNSSNDGINYWKGRKIIPLDKWLKITKANTISRRENYNVKEGLQYFPDDYFEWMFPLGIPEDP